MIKFGAIQLISFTTALNSGVAFGQKINGATRKRPLKIFESLSTVDIAIIPP